MNKAKMTKMKNLIYTVFDALDPSGENSDKYRNIFDKMNESQFDTFCKKFFKNENDYLILDIVDYERDLTMDAIEKAAKILGVPLFERVIIPFANMDKNSPEVTKYEVPVGYANIKRMQQLLSKKNTTSTEISERSALTGQVTGHDKNARSSDVENFALVTMNAEYALRELMGPRADDQVMKAEMYSAIAEKGYVSIEELTNKVENKTTLNTIDVFMIGMGIKTDLVTKDLHVLKSLD